jgi:hypothetical protein
MSIDFQGPVDETLKEPVLAPLMRAADALVVVRGAAPGLLDGSALLGRSLSYLTILELLVLQKVSKQWRDRITAVLVHLPHVELSQFWHYLGRRPRGASDGTFACRQPLILAQ